MHSPVALKLTPFSWEFEKKAQRPRHCCALLCSRKVSLVQCRSGRHPAMQPVALFLFSRHSCKACSCAGWMWEDNAFQKVNLQDRSTQAVSLHRSQEAQLG